MGAEALMRWQLPGHGEVSPGYFIPMAEESSLIIAMGDWVLNQVCEDFQTWRAELTHPGRIAVNLSLRQLQQKDLAKRVEAIFRTHGVSPTCFEFEITESTLMDNPDASLRILNELYSMGIHLSIDDFGTGYSSLSALQQFPISTLKIDQSFVRDANVNQDDATIVSTIIEMPFRAGSLAGTAHERRGLPGIIEGGVAREEAARRTVSERPGTRLDYCGPNTRKRARLPAKLDSPVG